MSRAVTDWLPRPDEQWIDLKTGRPSRRFYQFLRAISEDRLGGVLGASITQVSADVDESFAFTEQVNQYAQGVSATATATAQVSQNSGLTGAEEIPDPPTAPINPKLEPDPEV